MAKIKTYDYNSAENSITVTYESGVVRRYSVDRLPKSLQAFVLEPVEETVPTELPKSEETEKSDFMKAKILKVVVTTIEEGFCEYASDYVVYYASGVTRSFIFSNVSKNVRSYLDKATLVDSSFKWFLNPFVQYKKIVREYRVLEDEYEISESYTEEITEPSDYVSETPAPFETPEPSDDVQEVSETETSAPTETDALPETAYSFYWVDFRVNGNDITPEHTDFVAVRAYSPYGIMREFRRRIETEFDYDYKYVDVTKVTNMDTDANLNVDVLKRITGVRISIPVEYVDFQGNIDCTSIEVPEDYNESDLEEILKWYGWFLMSVISDDGIYEPCTVSAFERITEPAPAETPEQSDDVPKMSEPETSLSLETIISEIPFDLKIKPLCRKCKLLGSCYNKHPSKVLEDVYIGEHCDDVCGDCTLCCSDYKPLIEFPETSVELSDFDDDVPF